MITNEEFAKATKEFDNIEKRGSFYNMAIDLIEKDFEIEAYFLILATWNFARFRYAVNNFDINGFKEKIKELNPYFDKVKDKDFRTINFDEYKDNIKKIFTTLSSIKGVEYTGTSKIMHLRNRSVFVMWDGYIKGEKPKRYYNELEIVKSGFWKYKRYKNDPENYFQFLKDMQERFKDIIFQSNEKTFAKAIDEFNYVKITLPIQDMEKKE
ncbi:MAG: hypothetical protein PWQ87_512 [Candidatus Woesearchaeota archaeon]|nr:hypothetical protein [Candidatus Woesearchaeota archaeon]